MLQYVNSRLSGYPVARGWFAVDGRDPGLRLRLRGAPAETENRTRGQREGAHQTIASSERASLAAGPTADGTWEGEKAAASGDL